MNLVKTISTAIKNGKRIIKFFRMGLRDVQTSVEVSPYGIDGNPVKDIIGVYTETTNRGETYIIGYINKNQKADVGEMRIYSTNTTGVEQFYTWHKNDGTYELGGTSDNILRYSKTADVINEIQNDIQSLKQIFSTTWVPVPNDGGAALKAAAATWAATPLTENIIDAKVNEIKTL